MSQEIRVDLARITAKHPLRALADVNLSFPDGEVTIRRCAVFQKAGEPPWASLPRLPIEKHDKKSYVPLIELPRDLKQRLLDAVLAEYKRQQDAH